MVKVITYGTYDLLHFGHIRLLERAKALGDYLIVGVTSDDFDRSRGKINVQQSLEDRIAAVQATGIADKIIVESYEGQKIDDIKKYDVDIFTVGSDWEGHFDYLNEFCKVVYLTRTEGISSSEIRNRNNSLKMGMVGYSSFLNKFYEESKHVNAVDVVGVCTSDETKLLKLKEELRLFTDNYIQLLNEVDAVYIHSEPSMHYEQSLTALQRGKHVLCESPVALSSEQCKRLLQTANNNKCVFMEAIRTGYITAYQRLLLLLKEGIIGNVVAVDATCTSLRIDQNFSTAGKRWGALDAWGPTALLPVLQILGTNTKTIDRFSLYENDGEDKRDTFTKLCITYEQSTATIKVGTGVKSEGELIVSGTKGYIYVPAPWWKTDYFEIRYEDQAENKRYFYQVEGEGIRYELVALANAVRNGKPDFFINRDITLKISDIIGYQMERQ